MILDRVELADIHHPHELAEALHGQLGPLKSCVPIIQIAKALGIEDIKLCPLDGIEGMLLTDRVRSTGSILANTSKNKARTRFTVAHELGHFLLERHEFENTGFTCSAKDMKSGPGRSTHQRQEAEANQFAIAVLAPPYRVRPLLGKRADLADAITLRNRLEISFVASVRVLVDYCSQPAAAIWSQNGIIRYCIPSPAFPDLDIRRGQLLPISSAASRAVRNNTLGITDISHAPEETWAIRSCVYVTEQTRLGKGGFAVTLLAADYPD